MRNPDTSHNRHGDGFLLGCFFFVIIVGCILSITLTDYRPHFYSGGKAQSIEQPFEDEQWSSFKVYYSDNYFLDLKIDAEDPVTVKILDQDNQIVFSEKASEKEIKNHRLKLSKGEYKMTLGCESGYDVEIHVE